MIRVSGQTHPDILTLSDQLTTIRSYTVLQAVYHISSTDYSNIALAYLSKVPPDFRHQIDGEIYALSGVYHEDPLWGQNNAHADLDRLAVAIYCVAIKALRRKPPEMVSSFLRLPGFQTGNLNEVDEVDPLERILLAKFLFLMIGEFGRGQSLSNFLTEMGLSVDAEHSNHTRLVQLANLLEVCLQGSELAQPAHREAMINTLPRDFQERIFAHFGNSDLNAICRDRDGLVGAIRAVALEVSNALSEEELAFILSHGEESDIAALHPNALLSGIKSCAVRSTYDALTEEGKWWVEERIYDLKGRPVTTDPVWGKTHAKEDSKVLDRALEAYLLHQADLQTFAQYDALPQEDKDFVEGCIYELSGSPETTDPVWGKTHAKDDAKILSEALKLLKERDERVATVMAFVIWAAEDLSQEEQMRRGQAVQRCLAFLDNRSSRELDLAGLGLSCMPPIFGIKAFQERLAQLRLDHNRFTSLPPEMTALHHLHTLRLEYNYFTVLPDVLFQLTELRFLYLDGNRLTEIPGVIGVLQKLRYLSLSEGGNDVQDAVRLWSPVHQQQFYAWLAEHEEAIAVAQFVVGLQNPRTVFLAYFEEHGPEGLRPLLSPALAVVQARRNRISSLPPEIGTLQRLERLICTLPDDPLPLFDLPSSCEIHFTDRNLPPERIGRLHAKVSTQTDYRGPTFHFQEDERGPEGHSPEIALRQIFEAAEVPSRDFTNLIRRTESGEWEEQTATLMLWLVRLNDVGQYKIGAPEKKQAFAQAILEKLSLADSDPQFRDVFFGLIQGSLVNCGDRVALPLVYLDFHYRLATTGNDNLPLLANLLLRGVFAAEKIVELGRAKIERERLHRAELEQRGEELPPQVDDVEVFLCLFISLREGLRLEHNIEKMLFLGEARLAPEEIKTIGDVIVGMLNDPEVSAEFLISQDRWLQALESGCPSEYAEIMAQRERAVDVDEPDYVAIDRDHKAALIALTRHALS